jgi:hypothetical protein
MTKRPPMTAATNSPSYSKDFDYLIRRELDKLDTEHPPSTIQRHSKLDIFSIFIKNVF